MIKMQNLLETFIYRIPHLTIIKRMNWSRCHLYQKAQKTSSLTWCSMPRLYCCRKYRNLTSHYNSQSKTTWSPLHMKIINISVSCFSVTSIDQRLFRKNKNLFFTIFRHFNLLRRLRFSLHHSISETNTNVCKIWMALFHHVFTTNNFMWDNEFYK